MSAPGAAWDLAPRLEGEIVTLEPLTLAHRDALFAVARPPEDLDPVAAESGGRGAVLRRVGRRRGAGAREGNALHFATLDARPDGRSGARASARHAARRIADRDRLDVADAERVGDGANAEAKLLQLRYAFETLGCIRVDFETDEQNARSRRALEAMPAQFEGVLRHCAGAGRRLAAAAAA